MAVLQSIHVKRGPPEGMEKLEAILGYIISSGSSNSSGGSTQQGPYSGW